MCIQRILHERIGWKVNQSFHMQIDIISYIYKFLQGVCDSTFIVIVLLFNSFWPFLRLLKSNNKGNLDEGVWIYLHTYRNNKINWLQLLKTKLSTTVF